MNLYLSLALEYVKHEAEKNETLQKQIKNGNEGKNHSPKKPIRKGQGGKRRKN